MLRALEDTPDDAPLHADIEALCSRSDGWARYADALTTRAAATLNPTVARDLYVRLGRIAEAHLKDDRRSVDAYAKAVEHAGDVPELLEALDRLNSRLHDDKALADVLERRVPVAEDDKSGADLLHRLAVIQIDGFGREIPGVGDPSSGARPNAWPRRRSEDPRVPDRHPRAF